jgi:tetratricopeptide (TPR) repeat protein
MTPLLVAVLLAAGAVDPCDAVEAAERDPTVAAEYRAVGDLELAAGRRDSAAAAYRSALARDPGDGASRSQLASLCREQQRASAFERGLQLMRGGNCRAALPAFEEARATGDRAASLLEGICRYELDGDDARAASLLRQAEADGETRDSARFFLGLVALREARREDAVALLESSAGDRHLAPLAQDLSRAAQRGGKLVASFVAESGWDSNVDLAPDGSPTPSGSADGLVGATGALAFSPLGDTGPYARASATWREQLQLHAFDMGGVGAAAGWQLGRGRRYASLEYDYDYRQLSGAPYLSAHRIVLATRVDAARGLTLGGTYAARFETFFSNTYADFSGLRHTAEVDATLDLGRRWSLVVACRGGRDAARYADLSWWELGPRVALHGVLAPTVRIGLEAAWTWRGYDALDPTSGVIRSDRQADISALLEVDLAARWTARLALLGRRAVSNIAEFQYTKIVPSAGLSYTLGLL